MSKRFGKKRVPGCECEVRFTCRACLDAGMLRDGGFSRMRNDFRFNVYEGNVGGICTTDDYGVANQFYDEAVERSIAAGADRGNSVTLYDGEKIVKEFAGRSQ